MDIKFQPVKEDSQYFFNAPEPASKTVPKWFSKMPLYINGDKSFKFFPDGTVNQTVKTCSPFLDSFLTGYTISLRVDLQVTIIDGQHHFLWKAGRPMEKHDSRQIVSEQTSNKYDKTPFKFMNEWVIRTPKNYSTLFVHPLNRTDLPFTTLSGVVETDSFKNPIHFPFVIDKDFEGIIERGTPIVQLIPIKRESWRSSWIPYSKSDTFKADVDYYGKLVKAYKSLHWKKKDYK